MKKPMPPAFLKNIARAEGMPPTKSAAPMGATKKPAAKAGMAGMPKGAGKAVGKKSW